MATATKLLLVESAVVDSATTTPGDMPVVVLYDGAVMEWRASWQIPSDFSSLDDVELILYKEAAGNIYINAKSQKVTMAAALSASATGLTALAVTNTSQYGTVSLAATCYSSLSAIVAGDIVTFTIVRDASDSLDTYNTDLRLVGLKITYTVGVPSSGINLTGMTFQQLVENILEVFPHKGDTQIKIDLNQAQRRFAEKTKCFIKDVDISLGSVYALNLIYPTDLIVPYDVTLFDSAGNKLEDLVEWEIKRGYIEFTDRTDIDSLTMPSDIARISLKYAAYPALMSADTHIPDIPIEFHEALEYAVLAKYYQKSGKWQQARECNRIYSEFERDAKYYAATQFIGGSPTVAEPAI
jgi:hypothetical protein